MVLFFPNVMLSMEQKNTSSSPASVSFKEQWPVSVVVVQPKLI
jgi:hypothetical protein